MNDLGGSTLYNSCRGVATIRDVFISQKSRRQKSNQSVPNRRHQWLLGCCRPGSPFNFLEPSSFSTRGTNELIKRLVNFNAFWAHKCNPIRQWMTMGPFIAEDYPFAQGNMISYNFFSTHFQTNPTAQTAQTAQTTRWHCRAHPPPR